MARPLDVLLVDDSSSDTALTAETLKEADIAIELYCVTSAEEALDFLHGEGDHDGAPRPDVILLDLSLPKMTGHELMQVIRDDAELRGICVIVQTGSDEDRDVARSFGLGAHEFITKPLDIAEFRRVVDYITETS